MFYQPDHFDRLLHLAQQAKSICRPNPAVAAVIIKNGTIIGEGYTQAVGGHHAEVMAIKSVKDPTNLVNSELLVSLTPCNFHGRTPPCTEAIKKAKIKSTTFLLNDLKVIENTSPQITLINLKKLLSILKEPLLKKKILDVTWELFLLNLDFYKSTKPTKLPLPTITIKYAMSLDGKLANQLGESKWISSDTARKEVHLERSRHDAIMVGESTFFKDNPRLNVRLNQPLTPLQPIPIVVMWGLSDNSSTLTTEDLKKYHLLKHQQKTSDHTTSHRPCLVVIHQDSPLIPLLNTLLPARQIITFSNDRPWYHTEFLIKLSNNWGIQSIYAEGGANLHAHLINSGLVDRLAIYVCPKLFIGSSGKSPFSLSNPQNKSTKHKLPEHFPPLPLYRPKLKQLEDDIEWTGSYEKEKIINLWKQIMPEINY